MELERSIYTALEPQPLEKSLAIKPSLFTSLAITQWPVQVDPYQERVNGIREFATSHFPMR